MDERERDRDRHREETDTEKQEPENGKETRGCAKTLPITVSSLE